MWRIHNFFSKDAIDGGRIQIPALHSGDMNNKEQRHGTNKSKSKILHQYFCPESGNLEREREDNNEYLEPTFRFKNVTDQQIAEAIQRLNPWKVPDPSDLENTIYKQCK